MKQIAIRCQGIKKSYGDEENIIEALKGIDIEIEQGKLTLLVGPSGSGKSTLLSIITTILTPDTGTLFLLGHDVSQMSENERAKFCRDNLGIVFQSLFLVPTLTVVENVSLPLLIAGMAEDTAHEKSMEVLNKMKLGYRSHTIPTHLSRGQQQRVAIARAIVNDSKIIVCDEPTSSLDQVAGLEVMEILKDLAHNTSRAVLVVTHDPRTFCFGDHIIKISDGKIIAGENDA